MTLYREVKGIQHVIKKCEKPVDMPADFLYDIEVAYGALAQLGERIAGSDEVRGSIPLGSIIRKPLMVYHQGFLLFL